MTTITVWVMIASMLGNSHGGNTPIVVDNLATRADCVRIVAAIQKDKPLSHWSCTQVKKIYPG